MDILLGDLRYAMRVFRKSPSFVLVIVATLALGIGANTAIFSLMNAVLLRPLPVRHAQELVVLGDPTLVHLRASYHPPRTDIFSYRLYTELRDGNQVFTSMLVSCEVPRLRVSRPGGTRNDPITEQATGVLVSGNYFSTLGVDAFQGRLLTPADDEAPGAHAVAVLSYGFWKDKLAQDPNVVGSTLLFNQYPFTIVGITQPGFFGDTVGDQQDVWFPITMQAQVVQGRELLKGYRNSWFHILGRLKPGATIAQAGANLNVVLRGLLEGPLGNETQFTDRESLHRLQIEVADGSRGFSQVRGTYQQPLLLMMGIVGLVLLIACVNVANLLLARAMARRREVAVRLALGAGTWRIVRQLLTENILLAFAGGAAGLLVARWGTSVLLQMSHNSATEVRLDIRILGVTAALSLFAGLLFGLVPALRTVDLAISTTLKNRSDAAAGFTSYAARWNWGKLLVAGQVALSVLVLFAGGLLVRNMKNLRNIHLGLDQENLLMIGVEQVPAGYKTVLQRTQLSEELARRLSVLPGVRGVAYSQNGLFGDEAADTIKIDGYVPKVEQDWNAATDRIGPDYFRTLGIQLLEGREIGPQDTASAPRVTVVNEALSRFYFGDASPIGRTLWITDDTKPEPFQIVGVVANAKDHALRGQTQRRFYVAIAQSLDAIGAMHFMVRTSGNPDLLTQATRQTVRDFDATLPIIGITTLTNRIDDSIRSEILVAKLSGAFGALALLLACVGLYGLISYTVTAMTRAIGVRMALGAQQRDVLWMILREALALVMIGVAFGIPIALLCGRLLASTLYGLSGSDPLSLTVVVLLLAGIALLAGYVPARRAMNVNPIVALRDE